MDININITDVGRDTTAIEGIFTLLIFVGVSLLSAVHSSVDR